ncbi:hypothetical protein CAEBREN_15652 [Caenorhabditis brenneri]|uniref:Uncharacterized protein n=1 Tax=Caenorhabditis brenneri TaxID=135651 RepID=G0M827_CAEBE|nr:hypothetical protein CAEBREN_15652 [Caenorhabditis brenneri]
MKMKIKCFLLMLLLAEFCPPGLAQPKKQNSPTGAETLSAGWRQGEGESLFIIVFVLVVLGVATGTCYTILDFMKKPHETADEASEAEGDPQELEERRRHDEFMRIVPGISSTVVICTTTREMILYWICDIPILGPVPIEFTLQSYICSMLLKPSFNFFDGVLATLGEQFEDLLF